MTSVLFEIDLDSDQMNVMQVPIEIRRPNAALVSRTVAQQSVDLAPGKYIAVARLPSGQEIHKEFSVDLTNEIEVKLQLETADPSPIEGKELRRSARGFTGAPRDRAASGPEISLTTGIRGTVNLRLSAFAGNPLQGTSTRMTSDRWMTAVPRSARSESYEFHITNSSARIVQIGSPLKALNILLPSAIQPAGHCRVIMNIGRELSIEMHPASPTADALLEYTAVGFASEALTVASSKAELLLKDKLADPIAAAIGAYTLLRLGDLTALHNWTKNLHDWFPWLPDGATILAEHLARLGRHSEAIDILLGLASRGLPIFTDGLTYALNRLRLYISIGGSPKVERLGVDFEKLEFLRHLLVQLQRFATYVDFRYPVLNYRALNPNNPEELDPTLKKVPE
jgi:hypothetical protein